MGPATGKYIRSGFAFWSVLALVALVNAGLCGPLLVSLIGEAAAEPTSSLTYLVLAYPLIFLFFFYIQRPEHGAANWVLGALWVLLTVAFQGILFVGIFEFPLADFTEAFTISGLFGGNLFALQLLMLLVAPALFARVARNGSSARREDR